MRIVKFELIGLDNFCCYIQPLELIIEDGKMVIICGPNGIGKTTIFDSVAFTLYGMTSKGLRPKDIVNDKIKKNAHTWLEFSIDGVNYRIDRYHTHTKYGNTAIMERETVPYKKGSREVTDEVEKLLAPKKVFMNSIFFGQKMKTFFTDLDDTDRKDIFRKILRLDDYVIYYKKVTELIKEFNDLINSVDNQLFIKSDMINNYKDQIRLLLKEKEEFEINKKKLISDYQNKIKELNTILKRYEKEIIKYNNVENELQEVIGEINKYNQQINELEIQFKNIITNIQTKAQNKNLEIENDAINLESKENNKFNKEKNLLLNDQNEIDKEYQLKCAGWDKRNAVANSQILALSTSIDELLIEKNDFIKNVIEGDMSVCPMCNQEINKDTIDCLNEHIDELDKKIKEKQEKIKICETVKPITVKESHKFRDDYYMIKKESIRIKLFSLEQKHDKQIDAIKKKLVDAKIKLKKTMNDLAKKQTESVRKDKDEITYTIDKAKKNKNVIEEKINEYDQFKELIIKVKSEIDKNKEFMKLKVNDEFDKSRIKDYKNKIIINDLDIRKLEENKIKLNKKLKIFEFWKEAFSKSGIESMLIDESIPFMNERVNEYLDVLSFGRYFLSFDTVKQLGNKKEYRDKINLNVLDNESLADSKEKFSGGQKRILDIAIILTLCDLQNNIQGIKFNLMLFDEIFDSLDDDNIIRVANLLRSLTTDRSMYIITHRHIDQIDADEELKL